jgi:prevent-host-death family protein
MKTLEMEHAKGELSSYAEQVREEPVIVTEHGKPVMALVSISNAGLETVNLSTDRRFIVLMERSRELYKPGAGIPLEEIRRKYAIPRKRRKTTRKGARRARSARP